MNDQRMVDVGLLRFLNGEAPLEGVEFGGRHPMHKGQFWWRKYLTALISGPGVEPVAVFAYRRKGLDYFCTCDEDRYNELAQKPNLFEVAVFYTAPSAPVAPVQAVPDGVTEALQSLKEQVAAIVCHKLGHPGTAMAVQDAVIRLINRALAAAPNPPKESTAQSVACPTDKET